MDDTRAITELKRQAEARIILGDYSATTLKLTTQICREAPGFDCFYWLLLCVVHLKSKPELMRKARARAEYYATTERHLGLIRAVDIPRQTADTPPARTSAPAAIRTQHEHPSAATTGTPRPPTDDFTQPSPPPVAARYSEAELRPAGHDGLFTSAVARPVDFLSQSQGRIAEDVCLYHITHLNNIESILLRGGLVCHRLVVEEGLSYADVADTDIQRSRARFVVPFATRASLHDFVPFFFRPRAPMLYAIARGKVPGRDASDAGAMLHLVTGAGRVAARSRMFVFTDRHALSTRCYWGCDLQDLPKRLDWEAIESDGTYDGDEKDRFKCRMAEFLALHFVPWDALEYVGVSNPRVAATVRHMQAQFDVVQIPVHVKQGWYP